MLLGMILIPRRLQVLCFLVCLPLAAAFQSAGGLGNSWKNLRRTKHSSLTVFGKNEGVDDQISVVGDLDCEAVPNSSEMYNSLRNRMEAMEKGIGKRYVCRTQKGFLNVHQEPGDPYNSHNIVGQLQEGQIVTSIGPSRGPWVRHDGGGWSISIFGGFTWLEELKD